MSTVLTLDERVVSAWDGMLPRGLLAAARAREGETGETGEPGRDGEDGPGDKFSVRRE